MMSRSYIFKIFLALFATTTFTALAAVESEHCQSWELGKCTEGALTKLADSLNNTKYASNNRSETCDQVCKEGCPNCSYCGFCGLCGMYSDSSCVNVPYFTDRETCSVAYTKDCCDLCAVQCQTAHGVCSFEGFCNGGGPETDLLSYCVEKTTDDQCTACGQ
jgi:hypothetical protein